MNPYSKENPYKAQILERTLLTGPASQKKTCHVTLDIRGSGLTYEPGDCIGVLPENPPQLVEKTLESLGGRRDEIVCHPKSKLLLPLATFLKGHANLSKPTRSLLERAGVHIEDRAELRKYLEEHEVWELPLAKVTPQEFVDHLSPLLPRFYSIASSMEHVGEEIHLTVRHLDFPTDGSRKVGVCTHYLCEVAPVGEESVPLYVQKAPHFRLPEDHATPMIMVGPGTGVAPYRGFLQERRAKGARGDHWLFFGEWTRESEFFYEEEWSALVDKGHLTLETAFSRDQTSKVYVQHLLLERGQEVWEWLERGAHMYVCGDAKQMAPAVDKALHQIAEEHGGVEPKSYIKLMRKEKRYLRDIY